MGLFETIFKRPKDAIQTNNYFKMLNGYTPVFSNAPQSIYEMEITRAAIHSFATFCSKLKPELAGSAKKAMEKKLQYRPNPFMDTTKFLYRIATILSVNNTAFVIPIEDDLGRLAGYYPVLPQKSEIIESDGRAYLRYWFADGHRAAIEYEKVGILTQFQYQNDFFGEDNRALNPTMQLISMQNQGIINGVKNSASIRFLAKISNMLKPDDINAERKRFADENLGAENTSGVIFFDQKYSEIQQVNSSPFTINAMQMQQINENVFRYFGTNQKILQNNYTEDEWNAYYEGKIEPFAIQLSLVMTNMTFSDREISQGNGIYFTANRLQYASNATKLQISTQMFDRGLMTQNMVNDVWNWAHVEDGDKYFIRKEYAELSKIDNSEDPDEKNE